MKWLLRRTIFILVSASLAAFAWGLPAAALDIGLQNVNLSCSEGTNVDLAVDAATITQLSDSVGAINLYPAGDPALACSLVSRSDPGNPHYDTAVGGGHAVIVTRCLQPGTILEQEEDNFGLSAHALADSLTDSVGGRVNITISQCFST